jgi:hypothetical protein
MLLQKYSELKMDLIRTERHLLKEMGFICHVEHPHKFISNYLATLGTPPELRQEAWNLANDRYLMNLLMPSILLLSLYALFIYFFSFVGVALDLYLYYLNFCAFVFFLFFKICFEVFLNVVLV